MSRMSCPSRRRFLRGAFTTGGLVTVGLPALELFAPRVARASDSLFPQRFGLFFWGNGNRPEQWTPTGEGDTWSVSEELAPLAKLTDAGAGYGWVGSASGCWQPTAFPPYLPPFATNF